MKVFYRDEHIIVCIKPAGALSTDEPGGMPDLIRKAIGEPCNLRAVHRLDSVVAGLMVYAFTPEAASGLSRQMEDDTFSKDYMAVTEGTPEQAQAELRDFLARNPRERKTYVTSPRDRNGQEAILTYRTLGKADGLSLLRIHLLTGRTHQIRCQFASRHLPLFGDGKYGSANGREQIALWSCCLSFRHPISGEAMEFFAPPPAKAPWGRFPGHCREYENDDLAVEFCRSNRFSDCPYAEDCGFCAYQGMEYDKQLEKKQRKANRWFRELCPPEPMVPMEEPLGYRNRITLDFGTDRSGRLISGVYSRRAKRVVPIGKCRIDDPRLREIAGQLRALVMELGIPAYDPQKKTGALRQATLRISTNREVMVILSAAAPLPAADLANALAASCPEIRSILLETGKGAPRQVLYGAEEIPEYLMGQPLRLRADSFFPLNPAQSEKVYETALEFAALTGQERVLDVACGSGVLALAAAKESGKVLAVDAAEAIVKEAAERAKAAGVPNVRFVRSEPEAYLEALARSREQIDVLFLEAARCRNLPACMAAIAALSPRRIVCIGRDAEQLGAALQTLVRSGYTAKRIRSIDLLPFTEQAETVVLLSQA